MPRVAIAVQGRLHDGLDGTDAQWPLDDGRLAEPALPRTAAHDLQGDAIVRRLDERHDRPRRQRDGVEVLLDRAGPDLARRIAARAIDRRDRAVGVIFGLVELRSVGPGGFAYQLRDEIGSRFQIADLRFQIGIAGPLFNLRSEI